MTIALDEYFLQKSPDRKKETRYLAVINKSFCTSCAACATMCPVDCIYEVNQPGPADSYHVIDTARCIGCQLCYRVPTLSNQHYNLEICPWNAIDLLHNPNVKLGQPVLEPYYVGPEQEMPWGKLEEYGYQLYLNEEVRVRPGQQELVEALGRFAAPHWSWGDGPLPVVAEPEQRDGFLLYRTTSEGLTLLKTVFEDYPKLFLD